MFSKSILLIPFLIAITFLGCSSKSSNISYSSNKSFPAKSYKNKVYKALNAQYKDWKGVKYKYGGNSKSGIDCSSFVQKTFKDKLSINIPRTTALQSDMGEEVLIKDLQMGDLVFFKTGFNSRHVGIYIKDGKFLHASTKRGVTVSRLDNVYYSRHFWKIKRVIH